MCACLVTQLSPTHGNPMDRGAFRAILCSWDFPGKRTGTGCHFLLQDIFPIQGLNMSPALAAQFFTTEPPEKSLWSLTLTNEIKNSSNLRTRNSLYPSHASKTFYSHWWYIHPWLHKSLLAIVQSLSHVQLFVIPWTAACQASLSITISQSLLNLMSLESMMPSNHLILCCSLFLLPSIFPIIRVFSNKSAYCIRWPKCWSFSYKISASNEYSGLISRRIDWFDLFAVQGTLGSLLQHYGFKASVLWFSAFLMVRLSHPYMTTGKNTALTRWTSVGKIMSLLFNMLSRLVIASLSRRKHLLISWLQSPSAVILEPK